MQNNERKIIFTHMWEVFDCISQVQKVTSSELSMDVLNHAKKHISEILDTNKRLAEKTSFSMGDQCALEDIDDIMQMLHLSLIHI